MSVSIPGKIRADDSVLYDLCTFITSCACHSKRKTRTPKELVNRFVEDVNSHGYDLKTLDLDVSVKNFSLLSCSAACCPEILDYLLSLGATITGNGILLGAVRHKRYDSIQVLIKHGVEVDLQSMGTAIYLLQDDIENETLRLICEILLDHIKDSVLVDFIVFEDLVKARDDSLFQKYISDGRPVPDSESDEMISLWEHREEFASFLLRHGFVPPRNQSDTYLNRMRSGLHQIQNERNVTVMEITTFVPEEIANTIGEYFITKR